MPSNRNGWAPLFLCALLLVAPAAWAQKKPVVAVPAAEASRADLPTLVLPESIDIQQVDGLEYPGMGSVLRRGDLPVRLLPGEREVALRYNQLFQSTSDMHDIVKSKVLALRFVAEPGMTYRVVHPRFRDAREAREGVRNLVLSIEDASGNNRVIGARQTAESLFGQEAVTTRPDLVAKTVVAGGESTPVGNAVTTPAAGVNALDLLKFTWQNASPDERAAFLRWVQESR